MIQVIEDSNRVAFCRTHIVEDENIIYDAYSKVMEHKDNLCSEEDISTLLNLPDNLFF